MLQLLRDYLQSWVAWVIVVIICVTFAFWGVEGYIQGSAANGAVLAEVNGEAIYQRQLEVASERLQQQAKAQLGTDFEIDQQMALLLKRRAAEELILFSVLKQDARRYGYRVTQHELTRIIQGNPNFQENGRFSPRLFHEIAAQLLYSETAFMDDLRDSLMLSQVRDGVIDTAFLTADQRARAYALWEQTRDVRWLTLPAAQFAQAAAPSLAEQQAYYKKHQQEFTAPMTLRVDYVQLSVPLLVIKERERVLQNETELKQFYADHTANFLQPRRWQLAHILLSLPKDADAKTVAQVEQQAQQIHAKLRAGADFATLAKQYSADSISAKQGGLLPWMDVNSEIDPALKTAALALQQVGQLSAPVRTTYGFSIFTLRAQQAERTIPFTVARAQIIEIIAAQRAQQRFADLKERLTDLSFSNPGSLAAVSDALQLPVQRSPWFSKQGLPDGLFADKRIINTAFSDDVLRQGNNSDVVSITPDTVMVLRVTQQRAARQLTFAEAQPSVQQQLLAQRSAELAHNTAVAIVQALQQGADPNKLAAQHHLVWKTQLALQRNNATLPAELVNRVFAMPKPDAKHLRVTNLRLPNGDEVVAWLQATHAPAPKSAKDATYVSVIDAVTRHVGEVDYQTYVSASKENAKIIRRDESAA